MTTKYYALDDIEITLNDDFYQLYQLQDNDGAIDITGYVIKLAIKRRKNDTEYLIEPIEATLTDAQNGYFTFDISKDTLFPSLTVGNYYYSIEVTDLSNTTITRIKGEFIVSWEGA